MVGVQLNGRALAYHAQGPGWIHSTTKRKKDHTVNIVPALQKADMKRLCPKCFEVSFTLTFLTLQQLFSILYWLATYTNNLVGLGIC
jgi:hypothetical protein